MDYLHSTFPPAPDISPSLAPVSAHFQISLNIPRYVCFLYLRKGSIPLNIYLLCEGSQNLKNAKVWFLTIEGGGHPKSNPYSDLQFLLNFLCALQFTQFVDKLNIEVAEVSISPF